MHVGSLIWCRNTESAFFHFNRRQLIVMGISIGAVVID